MTAVAYVVGVIAALELALWIGLRITTRRPHSERDSIEDALRDDRIFR